MLTPLHRGASVRKSPVRSARLQATDDEEVLQEHSGLEVHALDNGLLDRDIEMRVEEPVGPPVPPPRPVSAQPVFNTVSLSNRDELPGDVSAWRQTWSGDKFKVRVLERIQEVWRQVVLALGLPTDEKSAAPSSADRPAQSRSLFKDVPEFVAKPYVMVSMDPMTVSVSNRDAKDILGGSGTALGASTFNRKFPMSVRDKRECLKAPPSSELP